MFLERRLQAERNFRELYQKIRPLPDVNSRDYGELVVDVGEVWAAYEILAQDFEGVRLALQTAYGARLFRPKREGLVEAVIPMKSALPGAPAILLNLRNTIQSPSEYDFFRIIIASYPLELAYRALNARNTLIDLERGLCSPGDRVRVVSLLESR